MACIAIRVLTHRCQPTVCAAHSLRLDLCAQELGWTVFLMLVKGYIPKLSLGVTNQLLPLMQVFTVGGELDLAYIYLNC